MPVYMLISVQVKVAVCCSLHTDTVTRATIIHGLPACPSVSYEAMAHTVSGIHGTLAYSPPIMQVTFCCLKSQRQESKGAAVLR